MYRGQFVIVQTGSLSQVQGAHLLLYHWPWEHFARPRGHPRRLHTVPLLARMRVFNYKMPPHTPRPM